MPIAKLMLLEALDARIQLLMERAEAGDLDAARKAHALICEMEALVAPGAEEGAAEMAG